MANTYSQISIQVVFAVKGRENIIIQKFRDELHKYIAGIVNDNKQKSLAVNGSTDHLHVFFGLEPSMCISDLVRDIKAGSSKWINERGFIKGKFNWQDGYAAFSYSKSQRDSVIKYIMNQEQHHRKKSFREEYLEMLRKAGIKFESQYLFEFYD
ncbi:MAG: IS200/IS605 family transposase [Chitinophagaceae bacterium]|nr:IS200/IS605 family transposase [Chitinophagaceae bacterium]